jgi:hypothetical protein
MINKIKNSLVSMHHFLTGYSLNKELHGEVKKALNLDDSQNEAKIDVLESCLCYLNQLTISDYNLCVTNEFKNIEHTISQYKESKNV